MRKRVGWLLGSALTMVAVTSPGLAQGPFGSSTSSPVPVTIQVVLSKGEADKKTSLPYTVAGASGVTTSLRIGHEVPVNATFPNGQTQFTLQQIGTQIDFLVAAIDDSGRYKVSITVTRREVSDGSAVPSTPPPTTLFYNFIFAGTLILRNGETAQITGTDIVSNETLRADVTLLVKKQGTP
jgi:hypothetical protein